MGEIKVLLCSRDPDYPRSRVIIKGLRKNGIEIDGLRSGNILSGIAELIKKYRECNVLIVGFPGGRYYFPVAKLLTLFKRKLLIFDAFISEYETLVFDRKIVAEKSLRSRFYFYTDKIPCIMSDLVMLDTNAQVDYFAMTFNIHRKKLRRLLIGTDDDVFYPRKNIGKHDKNIFLVIFYGSFIPVHGIEYIIKAAKLLEGYKDIKFEILGRGQTYDSIIEMSRSLGINNIVFKDVVPYSGLPDFIEKADVCLGIFGKNDKAKRAIPNKVYEIIAMKKPLITGDSPAMTEGGIINRKHALLVEMGSPESIAGAILELRDNERLRNEIAENGYMLFKQNFTMEIIGNDMKKMIQEFKDFETDNKISDGKCPEVT